MAWTENALLAPVSRPVGRLTLERWMADVTSSMPMPRAARALGFNLARTAYFCSPNTCTCATPLMVEMRCAITVSA